MVSPNRPVPGRPARRCAAPAEPVHRLRLPNPLRPRSSWTFPGRGRAVARRDLLTDEERRALFGIPADPDGLTRRFTLSRADRDLVTARRGDASRLGHAVQLALLRHPGTTLANLNQPVEVLVDWIVRRLEIPSEAF